jgi:tetratricopeptide repeat protein 21B
MHFKSVKGLTLSSDYFVLFNADILLDVAKQFLAACPDEPLDAAAPVPEPLARARKLLEIVSKAIPGHLECLFLLSKSRYLANDADKALSSVQQCIKLNPSYAEAYFMLAQLHLQLNQPKQALQTLENAISHNFKIRHNAEYHLLKAKSHAAIGDHEQA